MAKAVLVHQAIWQSRINTLIRERGVAAAKAGDATAIGKAQGTMLLMQYLITHGGGNAIGLFGFEIQTACEALLMTPEDVLGHVKVLAEVDFLTLDTAEYEHGYFRRAPYMWLHSMAKYQYELLDQRRVMSAGDRRVIGIRNQLESCPARTLVDLFVSRYNVRCSLGVPQDQVRNEVAIREEAGDRLIGPPIDLIKTQGVRP